jgi:ABC-type multidrug transport system fused ATPase/permease subunit
MTRRSCRKPAAQLTDRARGPEYRTLATDHVSRNLVNAHNRTSPIAADRMRERRASADEGGGREHARGWLTLVGLLRRFMRPYAGSLCVIMVLIVVQAAGNLYLPSLNADIINEGIVAGNTGYIWRVGGIMAIIVLVIAVASIVAVYLSSRASMGVGAALRAAVYRKVQEFSSHEMKRFGIPSLITRNINDVQQVQLFLQTMLTQLVIAVVICVGAVIMAVRESARLSLLLAVTIPAMGLILVAVLITMVPLSRSVQVRIDRSNQVLREQITGVRVIRAFLRMGSEQDRIRIVNADITRIGLRITRIAALAAPALLGVANLSGVAVFWFGGRLASQGSIPIGNTTAFLMYIMLVLAYVGVAVSATALIPQAVASAERIRQVIDAVPAISDPPRPVDPAEITGYVEFRHVTFGYPGSERPVLNDVTFNLRPGQISAIIGGTGSGKTTVLNLISRFFDVASGSVLINETDVRMQSGEKLWSTIGLVPQASFLFGGTVASNLRFSKPEATDQELWRALDVAQALDFVASMPGQLDAPVDQGGTNVSGGQRQRLSIARAVLRRPSLYLFDDCFSALDPATDARLRTALRAETGDAVVVIVTQRVSTIMHADQIIVLDAGNVVGVGTHEQLLAGCGPYQEIVASQLGEGAAA